MVAKNPAPSYIHWAHLKRRIENSDLFPTLGGTLWTLCMIGNVARDISTAFSIFVNSITNENTALVTGSMRPRVRHPDQFSFLCHSNSTTYGLTRVTNLSHISMINNEEKKHSN